MGTWAIVVPTCRPALYQDFLKAWEPLFWDHDVAVYPVFDDPASWEKRPGWVPRRSGACRSYGFWQAWADGHTYTLTLDDDTRPLPDVDVFAEYEAVFNTTWPCVPYLSVGALTDSGREMRGFPYAGRGARCVVQYGGWEGMLDYDAQTQLAGVPAHAQFAQAVMPVPKGCAVSASAMNVAWRTEFSPVMWQIPPFEGRYGRCDDLWAGLIQKRVLDARGEVMVVNGRASVLHDRASDPVKNALVEQSGLGPNELLWDWLCEPPVRDHLATVHRLFDWFEQGDPEYAEYATGCFDEWMGLFADDRATVAA